MDGEVPYFISINFGFCGKFLAMPQEQLELYQDEEIYGTSLEFDYVEAILKTVCLKNGIAGL